MCFFYIPDNNDASKIAQNEWILYNIDVTGYYRVNYDNRNWDNLLNQLDTDRSVSRQYPNKVVLHLTILSRVDLLSPGSH